MNLERLNNAYEAVDFDINSDEHIPELGRQLADKQVIVVKQKITEERHFDILDSWGSPGTVSYTHLTLPTIYSV